MKVGYVCSKIILQDSKFGMKPEIEASRLKLKPRIEKKEASSITNEASRSKLEASRLEVEVEETLKCEEC